MLRRLTISDLEAVRRALKAGVRHVDIARALKLGVWTVDRIAARERYMSDAPSESELPEDDAPPDYSVEDMRRCSGCGAIVYVWPCLACRMAVTERIPCPATKAEAEHRQIA